MCLRGRVLLLFFWVFFLIYLLQCVRVLQSQARLVAHYHCVVCSVTIARKTDMISHLKRHVNKGETEASYSGTSDTSFEEPGEKTLSLCRSSSGSQSFCPISI